MKIREGSLLGVAFLLCGVVEFARGADAPAEPRVHKTIFGVMLHDRGPFSDRNEKGVDPIGIRYHLLFGQR